MSHIRTLRASFIGRLLAQNASLVSDSLSCLNYGPSCYYAPSLKVSRTAMALIKLGGLVVYPCLTFSQSYK